LQAESIIRETRKGKKITLYPTDKLWRTELLRLQKLERMLEDAPKDEQIIEQILETRRELAEMQAKRF